MINFIKQQRSKYPKLYEILRFLIIGGVATVIDMAVMGLVIFLFNKNEFSNDFFKVFSGTVSVADWQIVLATAIGFIVGLIFNYVFSLLYVYDYESDGAKSKKGFIIFSILSTIGLILQTVGMFVFYSLLGINEWIAKIVLVIVVLVFNYITRKIFVFKNKDGVDINTTQVEDKESIDKNQKIECCEEKVLDNSNQNLEKYNEHKKDEISIRTKVLNVLFVLSSVCLCLFFYNSRVWGVQHNFVKFLPYIYACLTLIIVLFFLIFINKNVLEKITFNFKSLKNILAYVYSIIIVVHYFVHGEINIVRIFLGLGASVAVYCYCYFILSFIFKFVKTFWQECDNLSKKIFKWIVIVGVIANVVILLFTRIFTYPGQMYDALFSFDTGPLLLNNYQVNQFMGENDFRHFLMSLFILPFGVIPSIGVLGVLKGFLLGIVQIFLTAFCIIKIKDFLKLKDNKFILLFVLFYLVCAGNLFNIFTVEKFVFSLFYIVTTIDYSFKKSPLKWLFFIGAVGIMTTNIFLLPLVLLLDKKPFKHMFAELVVVAIIFVSLLILSGQFNLLLFFKYSWEELKRFTSASVDMSILSNLSQYFVFIASTIVSPTMIFGETISQTQPMPSMMVIGAIVLTINILGFAFNFKDKFAQSAFYWQIFMFVLLVIVGWGAALNEMFIYSALFLWSTISLIYKFFDKVIKSKKAKFIFFSVLICAIFAYNIVEFIRVLIYGMTNFSLF